jgi:hypothetical protein
MLTYRKRGVTGEMEKQGKRNQEIKEKRRSIESRKQ